MRVRAVVGDSGSGKTLLVERLVGRLHAAGQRVAYLKHAPHGFHPGRAGSDTERVAAAGADEVVIVDGDGAVHPVGSSAVRSAPDLLIGGIAADIALLEGWSASSWPKLRVRAAGAAPREVAPPILLDLERGPEGFTEADLAAAAEVLLRSAPRAGDPVVTVRADGTDVPVGGFAARAVAATVAGLLGTLHGVEGPRSLSVEVRWTEHDDGAQGG